MQDILKKIATILGAIISLSAILVFAGSSVWVEEKDFECFKAEVFSENRAIKERIVETEKDVVGIKRDISYIKDAVKEIKRAVVK